MRPTNRPVHKRLGENADLWGAKDKLDSVASASTVLTFVGHATAVIEMDGEALVTDPLLRDRLWHLRRDVPCAANGCLPVERLSAVIISHLHLDHADVPSLRRIPSDVPVITPQGTEAYLRARVPQPIQTIELWESHKIGSVEVIAVPAAHRGPGSSLTGFSACAGFVIRGSTTVYFAGDTALFAEMAELGETFAIDVALLPVWGYGPNLRGDHLTPRDAAHALAMLRPRFAVPIHWGTFRPLGKLWSRLNYFSDPPYTFAGYAAYLAPETEVRVLEPGESFAF